MNICLFTQEEIDKPLKAADPRAQHIKKILHKGVGDTFAVLTREEGAPATVCVHSLDGAPIAQSCRMLLTHLTDVHGEGAKFTNEAMTTVLGWGGRPLVSNGTAAEIKTFLGLNAPEVKVDEVKPDEADD